MVPGVSPLDAWSIVHVASGAALAVLGVNTRWSVSLLIAFEILEAGLRLVPAGDGGLFEFESFGNIVADIFLGLLGYIGLEAVYRRMAWRRLLDLWFGVRP